MGVSAFSGVKFDEARRCERPERDVDTGGGQTKQAAWRMDERGGGRG
ncbi:hypothetical protein [Phenylobacterium sp.]|nr:hypothetical protein [Phenylobacterium sp.]MCA6291808.1 hypothetical protein [Phenylobacterium sp.]MCA6312365.1 hypothetical protein [Phenylobacterium sp.]